MIDVRVKLQPSEIIEHGQSDRENGPTRVIVVEPIAVREDVAGLMLGMPVETLRDWRKKRTGPPCRKAGATVIYLVEDLRAWAKSCPELVKR
ncbi:MAG: hypothetical protein H6Q00_1651 [Holophagaceae bacterium]|nr:hypothetical protein [Holophagaceae bacterium]